MILQGKAKELFISFMCKKLPAFTWFEYETLLTSCQNALIIEWLDSVGVAIIVGPKNLNSWDYEVHDLNNLDYVFECEYSTRQEATTEAIKVAVELINKEL